MARCGLNTRNWDIAGVGFAGKKADAISMARSMSTTIGEALANQWSANQTCPVNKPCGIRDPDAPDCHLGFQDRTGGGEWQVVPGLWLAVRRVRTVGWFWCLRDKDEPRTFPTGFDEKGRSTKKKGRRS